MNEVAEANQFDEEANQFRGERTQIIDRRIKKRWWCTQIIDGRIKKDDGAFYEDEEANQCGGGSQSIKRWKPINKDADGLEKDADGLEKDAEVSKKMWA